jgi:hypothetical protein
VGKITKDKDLPTHTLNHVIEECYLPSPSCLKCINNIAKSAISMQGTQEELRCQLNCLQEEIRDTIASSSKGKKDWGHGGGHQHSSQKKKENEK